MFVFFGVFLFVFVFLPSSASAWGPLTHIYLGTEIFFMGAAIPPAVYSLLRKYRQDYIYGNVMADVIFAKKYLPKEKNPHNWDVALELADEAATEPERAFALGYMSHLAADTVAHSRLTGGKRDLHHSLLELKAESIIDRHYLMLAMKIDSRVQKRGDVLLKRCLESPLFSFKTNKRILKGVVLISALSKPGLPQELRLKEDKAGRIEALHEESIDRMLDVLQNGRRSKVLRKCPMGGRLH
jgi:hypothetical protein